MEFSISFGINRLQCFPSFIERLLVSVVIRINIFVFASETDDVEAPFVTLMDIITFPKVMNVTKFFFNIIFECKNESLFTWIFFITGYVQVQMHCSSRSCIFCRRESSFVDPGGSDSNFTGFLMRQRRS